MELLLMLLVGPAFAVLLFTVFAFGRVTGYAKAMEHMREARIKQATENVMKRHHKLLERLKD